MKSTMVDNDPPGKKIIVTELANKFYEFLYNWRSNFSYITIYETLFTEKEINRVAKII